MKAKTLSELHDQLWILALTIFKSALMIVALVVAFAAERIARGAAALLSFVSGWSPVRPQVFNVGGSPWTR